MLIFKKKIMKITDWLDAKLDLGNEIIDLEVDKAMLIEEQRQLYIDMEQEAEPEGGDVCDQYADCISKVELQMGNIVIKIAKLTKELNELEEKY